MSIVSENEIGHVADIAPYCVAVGRSSCLALAPETAAGLAGVANEPFHARSTRAG